MWMGWWSASERGFWEGSDVCSRGGGSVASARKSTGWFLGAIVFQLIVGIYGGYTGPQAATLILRRT